ncbi:hypothetical protein Clacol_005202 [Clathrus columnatus]|uniref:Uncharacterized protein n=1 Tax=Clathrus columnatus TaxID=1419009 RepID=A0AAV5ACW4_9AGAM|nr:hypothetical protein Clacol_005202 [Clathrus columnatus]
MDLNLFSLISRHHIHENNYHILWNSVLTYHFPIDLGYGVTLFQTSISGEEVKTNRLMVVKVKKQKRDNIVLVVVIAMHPDDKWLEKAVEELTEIMKEASKRTHLPTVYGIVGSSMFFVYKLEKSGPPEPQCVFGPSNPGCPSSLDYMTNLAAMINEMATRSIQE